MSWVALGHWLPSLALPDLLSVLLLFGGLIRAWGWGQGVQGALVEPLNLYVKLF